MAPTETMTFSDTLDSQYLSNSFSNLSRSKSTNSLIVRTYKQATQLYLTRRFKDSLEVLEPIVSPRQTSEQELGDAELNGAQSQAAPVAQTSRSTRTKVWVFYLSLLHEIVELGPEEGRSIFGSTQWRQLALKVREGTIWDEVVRHGYAGDEGDVDADVVVNLATLLLRNMATQKTNQQHLEAYLAASDAAETEAGMHVGFRDGISTPMSTHSSSPKALASRLKIIELYTLHVLPANEEWDYASQFIEMSDMLDEERKETFSQALQEVKEEREGTIQKEKALQEQKAREEEQRRVEEETAARHAAEEQARADETRRKAAEEAEKAPALRPSSPAKPNTQTSRSARPTSSASGVSRNPASPPHPTNNAARGRAPNSGTASNSLLQQLTHTVQLVRQHVSLASPRMLLLFLAFLVLLARRDLRMRLRRQVEGAWDKVMRTVGMGVKVSYV